MAASRANRRGRLSIDRLLLTVAAAIALLLAPLSLPGTDGAFAQTIHLSTSHDGNPSDPDHSGQGHGLVHCLTCALSYLPGGASGLAVRPPASANRGRADDDAALRSLNPDRDPPVPRPGFSPA